LFTSRAQSQKKGRGEVYRRRIDGSVAAVYMARAGTQIRVGRGGGRGVGGAVGLVGTMVFAGVVGLAGAGEKEGGRGRENTSEEGGRKKKKINLTCGACVSCRKNSCVFKIKNTLM
jgi:hypothetical protein